MTLHRKWIALAVLVAAAGLVLSAPPGASAKEEAVIVGRIAHTEGQILRFVPDEKDWVATVKDAPFGMNDALYSDAQARAEFIMPNGLWTRIGGSTQIQAIALRPDASEMDVAAGVARFYNKSDDGLIKVTTPFGFVLAEPASTFDLYVGDQSVEVIALNGKVDFIHQADNNRYDVEPGKSSIIADAKQVGAGEGTIDAEWDDWNASRDSVWTKRVQVKGDSTRYLPPQIQDDAYALEENGRWERVYYEGEYKEMWRPTRVADTWQPFTAGRWTDWYGDQCWVPEEPFGYVTHHYGNWVHVNSGWFWSPPAPVVTVAVGPAIPFAWYPGRVAWIHSGHDVGWVPLAPREHYYSHHHWGPGAVVVAGGPAVSINIGALAFASAAVIVPQRSFYSVPSYTSVRVTNINHTTIINNYRSAPIINNTVINNYNSMPGRHNFTNVQVTQKPHMEVTRRIQYNQQVATRVAPGMSAAAVRQTMANTRPVQPLPAQQAALPPPRVTNRIVPAEKMNAPAAQVAPRQAVDIKRSTKPATASAAVTQGPGGPPRTLQPGATGTTAPGQPTRPGVTAPGTAHPGQPSGLTSPRTGVQQPGAAGTTAPGQPTRPGVTAPGATQPGQPAGPTSPRTGVQQPGAAGTTAPGQPTRPSVTAPGTTREGTSGPTSPRTGMQQPGQPVRPGVSTPGSTREGTTPSTGTRPGVTSPGSTRETPAGRGFQQPGTQSRPGEPSSVRTPTGRTETPSSSGRTPSSLSPAGSQPGMTRPQQQAPAMQQTRPQQQAPAMQQTRPQQQAPAMQQRPQQQAPAMQQRPAAAPAVQQRPAQPAAQQPKTTQPGQPRRPGDPQ
ncbi:MAG: hypothetical protein LLG06_07510 [Desulfobacteraceae bacterium]|nr:hypothetical protein [Desulfobacteraceae bacterium]